MTGEKEQTQQVNYSRIRIVVADRKTGEMIPISIQRSREIEEADRSIALIHYASCTVDLGNYSIVSLAWGCGKVPDCRLAIFHAGECEPINMLEKVGTIKHGRFSRAEGLKHVH